MNENQVTKMVLKSLFKNGIFASQETARDELEFVESEYMGLIQDSLHGVPYSLSMRMIVLEKNIELIKKFLAKEEPVKTHKRKRSE